MDEFIKLLANHAAAVGVTVPMLMGAVVWMAWKFVVTPYKKSLEALPPLLDEVRSLKEQQLTLIKNIDRWEENSNNARAEVDKVLSVFSAKVDALNNQLTQLIAALTARGGL